MCRAKCVEILGRYIFLYPKIAMRGKRLVKLQGTNTVTIIFRSYLNLHR
jgi:hypothetical protein